MVLLLMPCSTLLPSMDLESAVALALKGNRTLMEYELESRNGRWALAAGLREFFPELNIAFSSSDSVAVGDADTRIKRWSFTMNQLIFSGGQQLWAYRSAKRELQLRDLRAADMRIEMAYTVALAYAEVLKNREILKIRQRYFRLLEEQNALALLEQDLGLLTAYDLIEIGLRGREYELELKNAREALKESRFALSELLSIPSSQLPPLEGKLNPGYRGANHILDGSSPGIPVLRERAGNLNRDLLDLGHRESNARRELRDARLSWLPRIEAEGEYSLSGRIRSNEEASFSLGLNFIFNTPLLPASLEVQAGKSSPRERNRAYSAETDLLQNIEKINAPFAARTRLTLIRMEREELQRQIDRRVEVLADSIVLNRDRLAILEEKIILESEKLKIQETRMAQGELTRLDYVESELQLAEYETDRIEWLTKLYSAVKELERLCGDIPLTRKNDLIIYPDEDKQ